DRQLPASRVRPGRSITSSDRVSAPANSRSAEKLAASIAPTPRAARHRTEFAAKAVSARMVNATVRTRLALRNRQGIADRFSVEHQRAIIPENAGLEPGNGLVGPRLQYLRPA